MHVGFWGTKQVAHVSEEAPVVTVANRGTVCSCVEQGPGTQTAWARPV